MDNNVILEGKIHYKLFIAVDGGKLTLKLNCCDCEYETKW